MIRITSIRRCHIVDYDNIYLIVRSIASLEKSKSSILTHATHVPELSPSRELFYRYLDWSKSGCWDQNKFDNEYKPTFLNELNNDPNAAAWLEKLAADDRAGKKIALLCFCPNENLCHRIIIGDILKEKGCNVVLDKDIDNNRKK